MIPHTLAPLLFTILIFFFIGCDNKDIVSPVADPGPISESSTISEPDWISLPANEENSRIESFTVSKLIPADRPDFITLIGRYDGGELGSVSMACVIVFPRGALKEDISVTMTIDDKKGYVTFQPEMEFNEPAKFTMILKGVDLDKVDMNNADFINFNKYNGIERIDYKRLNIDREYGSIGVYEAEINQLSKCGFTI